MNHSFLITTAIRSIRHHLGRSILTTLGITIGVAALVAMLALGYGAEKKVTQDLMAMGTNQLYINAGNIMHAKKIDKKQSHPKPLTECDVAALKNQCQLLAKTSPFASTSVVCEYNNKTASIQIKSGNEHLIHILNRSLRSGSNITRLHVQHGTRVIVLGNKTAHDLFGQRNPIGLTVVIKNIPFLVIGVLKTLKYQMDDPLYDANYDSIIPYRAFKKYIEKSYTPTVRAILASAYRAQDMQAAVTACTKILRMRRNIKNKEPNDFTVWDQQSMINAAKKTAGVFTLFLFIVAAIALLVGGIGVMNIMSVTVSERTKEIGIRMALGATKNIILWQFLYQALLLCLMGGTTGILLGIGAPIIIASFTGWLVVITPLSIVIALSAMMLVGIIFGFYPAYKAAGLNPVQALEDR